MSKLPPIALKPYCRQPGCPNPGAHVEVVTGIGTDPMTGEPIRRARVWCRWHGRHFQSIDDYREQVAAQRVQEALLARGSTTMGIDWGNGDHHAVTNDGTFEITYLNGKIVKQRRL